MAKWFENTRGSPLMRSFGPFSLPKTDVQARVFILRHVDQSELEWFKEHPGDLQKRIDAILGRVEDDDIGTRWVYCEKHGLTTAAMKFGIDDRCGHCVGEALAKACKGMKIQPMNRPVGSLFFLDFDVKNRTKDR